MAPREYVLLILSILIFAAVGAGVAFALHETREISRDQTQLAVDQADALSAQAKELALEICRTGNSRARQSDVKWRQVSKLVIVPSDKPGSPAAAYYRANPDELKPAQTRVKSILRVMKKELPHEDCDELTRVEKRDADR